jgi:type I restriction enzyme M protein
MQLPLIQRDPASGMAEFEQILASNSGEDPFDSAIKLLAAKLAAEKLPDIGEFQILKTPEATHRAVSSLYRQALRKWPELNGTGLDLGITPDHLVRSMRPLLGWRLLESDLSWLDATLERLVARDAKGALGQYFTPREIIRFCVGVLNPDPRDKVLDPACGSGGFLFEATRHSLKFFRRAPACLGIDFGARAIKVAALLAAATPRAKIAISKANSIDGRPYAKESPQEWSHFLARDVGSFASRAKTWGDWNRLGCSVLLTNPPFAGDIDEFEVLEAYEAQRSISGRQIVSREHLFLERAVNMLRPQGRLAIVLPQGLLANPSASYLREWLFQRCRVLGVVGLHPHSFLPYTSVKTSLLFAAKMPPDAPPGVDYPMFFARSRDCGKDSRGRTTGTADYDQIAVAFSRFLQSQRLPWANRSMSGIAAESEAVLSSEAKKADRLDAEYFDPQARALFRKIDITTSVPLSSLVSARPDRFKKSLYREINYVDISSVDAKTGLAIPTVIQASEAPSRASYIVQPGDVLVSTVRPDRNVVALITASSTNLPTIASNGFCVLRPKSIDPETLFAYCKTDFFKRMLTRHATASMYPTVTDKDVLGIPFVEPPAEIVHRVRELVRSGLEMIQKAQAQLVEAAMLMARDVSGERAVVYEIRQESRSYKVRKRKS